MSQSSSGSAREAPDSHSAPRARLTILPPTGPVAKDSTSKKTARRSKSAGSSSNVLALSMGRLLLWATPRGDALAYEVSKAVHAPLQARCTTAPLCPGESPGDGLPGWIEPTATPLGGCPYDYRTRGQCITDRNVEALLAALFSRDEGRLVGNYLKALGYTVREEQVSPESLDGTRILHAHARIGNSHEVRVSCAPGVGEIVLVRDLSSEAV